MTKYETDKKTGDVSKLVKKAYYNPKITEKEGKYLAIQVKLLLVLLIVLKIRYSTLVV